MQLRHRTQQLEPSPITTANGWLAHRRSERKLIDLSQAAPAYGPPAAITERIVSVATSSDGSRYSPTSGLSSLREAFAEDLKASYGGSISAGQVLPTAGCNQAFCLAASTLAGPGEEIILPVPYYFNHDMWLRLDGVSPTYLFPSSDDPAAFVPDPAAAERLLTERTRAIVLVTPGNPTGVVTPPEVLHDFFDLAQSRGLALIVDETYRNFRPTIQAPHELYRRPSWVDTAVFLHSFSKDFAIPGYRVGALVGGEPFLDEAMKLSDCMQISAPRVSQEAATAGLLHSGTWRQQQADRIADRMQIFKDTMADAPGGFKLVTAGAFFGWVRHPFTHLQTEEVVRRLVVDHDVLVIPGTAFTPTDTHWLRFSFANLDASDFPVLAQRLNECAESILG